MFGRIRNESLSLINDDDDDDYYNDDDGRRMTMMVKTVGRVRNAFGRCVQSMRSVDAFGRCVRSMCSDPLIQLKALDAFGRIRNGS